MQNILFVISAMGLGHVTRSLSLIRHYLKGNKVIVLSELNVLNFLKAEFPDCKNLKLLELASYPALERGKSNLEYAVNLVRDGLRMPKLISEENKAINKIIKDNKIDFIISDGVYGAYSTQIPCFLLTHQIAFQLGDYLNLFGKLGTAYNQRIFKKFTKVFVLDFEEQDSIAGKLAHNSHSKSRKFLHVGILSQYKKTKTKQDIDYLVIISGFLLEHKTDFYKRIIKALKNKPGKKVVILGDYLKDYHKTLTGDIEVYSSFKGLDKNELFNRSKYIISRTGYTTIMDLVELEKPATLIPTPNQSEQVYLAGYLKKKGYFNIIMSQKLITNDNIVGDNREYIQKFTKLPKTKDTVKKLTSAIEKYTRGLER